VLASKALSKETTVIYVHLSSSKVAEDRLVARGTDSADQIKIRVERYESDVKSIAESDLVTEKQMLLNDVLEDAYEEFKKRILS
jgi:guanylate kinase